DNEPQPRADSEIEILVPTELRRRIALAGREISIGRDPKCAIRLDFPDLSRVHARIYSEGDAWLVEDCGSRNGITVNGETTGRRELSDGDLVKLGHTVLRFNGKRRAVSTSALANVKKLLEVSVAISSSLVLDEVLERIIDSVAAVTAAERTFLMLANPAGEL